MTSPPSLPNDPMGRLIAEALQDARIEYETEERFPHLDFYLPDADLYIEVKRMHSARISYQMARVENVIVAQGRGAVEVLAALIRTGKLPI
ncbi:hypothetical protein [Sphingomonas sp. VL_57B]|jgi:hypothetical protein|uniref:hypothetical protein n=1 Tax=Sphingomonas sp. VL_57B TaxID=3144220 RepID=UPI0031F55D88